MVKRLRTGITLKHRKNKQRRAPAYIKNATVAAVLKTAIISRAAVARPPSPVAAAEKAVAKAPISSKTVVVQQPSPVAEKAVAKAPCAHLCTVAGSQYLFKVVTLYRSLHAVSDSFHLYVCCIDDNIYNILKKMHFRRCTLYRLDDIENGQITPIKGTRSVSELCWTLKSFFMLYLLKFQSLPSIIYCDSDLCFFSDPIRILRDWGGQSIFLCKQRDLDWVENKYGKYQAGLLGFKNDDSGRRALEWWKNKCLNWCYHYEDTANNRWGDQKYLDELPGLFGSVVVSEDLGINAAPWNTIYNNNYHISTQGNRVTIGGKQLVAFHFACVDIFSTQQFDLWNLSKISISNEIMHNIYIPYLHSIQKSVALVKEHIGNPTENCFSVKRFTDAKTPYTLTQYSEILTKHHELYTFCTISSHSYVPKTIALYRSLQKHISHFHMWICCMDQQTYDILKSSSMPNATLIHLRDVETSELKNTKTTKHLYEYCWSLKPVLCTHIFLRYGVKNIIYCDSDLYFFSDPKPIYQAWSGYLTFINHQFGTPELMKKHGVYQAGMVGFTNDQVSLNALDWWRRKCIEWCYDNHDDPQRWGDQKYLEKFHTFSSLKVNDNYGILAAPWNIVMNNFKGLKVTRQNEDLYIGSDRLVCYHFGSIRIFNENEFDIWKQEPQQFDPTILRLIYTPYLQHIRNILRELKDKGFNMTALYCKDSSSASQNYFRLPS